MDRQKAEHLVRSLQNQDGKWINKRHIATLTFRAHVPVRLYTGDVRQTFECIELFFSEELPLLDSFSGILDVDEHGIWYCDDDGTVEDLPWRPTLIPWAVIRAIRLHQSS